MDYLDKFGRKSFVDIMRLDPNNPEDWERIKEAYRAVDIDKVVIDGDTFTNYKDFQFTWEKSYVKEPGRSGAGSIGNLNGHATFIVPRLIINFSIMSIDDYRALVRKDLERNEFVVECYDPIYNRKVKAKMYFAPLQMAKLHTIAKVRYDQEAWEEFIELAGVREYNVEMIGTNADLDLVSVIYHLNPPTDVAYTDKTEAEDDVYAGEDLVIGGAAKSFTSETFGGKYKFSKWNTSAANPTEPKALGNYLDGYAYTINTDLVLYAQWDAVEDYTLTYNYGLADALISEDTYSYVTSKKVRNGIAIGELPSVPTPFVEIEKEKYYPYYGGAWYKTPILAPNSVPVSATDPYWLNRDGSIYLLYYVWAYPLTLYIGGEFYQSLSAKYDASLMLPIPVREGYTFDGWYTTTADFKEGTKFSGNMPPYDLNLYGRWIEDKI